MTGNTTWVFGYGSLMWNPGFTPAETVKAHLTGYARSFCLRSFSYRGTEDYPGLVLGLDESPEARCSGLAMRIPDEDHDEVRRYLYQREMTSSAYREAVLPVALEDGRTVPALAYVMQRDHWHYAGGLCPLEQAQIIARAHGGRGPNAEYLFNTAQHLAEIGVVDTMMEQLSDAVRRLLKQPD